MEERLKQLEKIKEGIQKDYSTIVDYNAELMDKIIDKRFDFPHFHEREIEGKCKHAIVIYGDVNIIALKDKIEETHDNLSMMVRKPDNEVKGLFITHAHIGHYAGLMYFGREAFGSKDLKVNVLPKMANFLKTNGPWSQLVEINNINIQGINFGRKTNHLSNISVIPIKVPHRDEYSETAAYEIIGKNKKALFIPDIDKWEKWDKNLIELVQEFDYLLLDATFYDSKEINRDISEIPHPLVSETISLLDNLTTEDKSKVYFIHMNHTNMMLDPKSDLTNYILSKGFNIARLGLKLEL